MGHGGAPREWKIPQVSSEISSGKVFKFTSILVGGVVGLHRGFHIQGVTYNRPPKSGKPLVLGSQTSILGEKRAKGFIFQLVFTKYEPFWAQNTGNIPDRGVTFGSNI